MFIRFTLTAALHFSKDIPPEAYATVEKTVDEANTTLFRRGVPAEAEDDQIGTITRWNVDGPVLTITIESGHTMLSSVSGR
jgi:hypothetical protein